MDIKIKRWTHLGLGAALMTTTALAGCGEPAAKPAPAEEAPAADTAAPADVTPSEADVEAQLDAANAAAASGGEGEGGVAIDAAKTDPVVYNIALAVAEAHVRAARDAYRDGETQAAGEMFAHPVSEVLFDMEPVFEARGVADFTGLFTDASGAVFAGESVEQISNRTDGIVAALDKAAQKAPDNGTSPAAVTTGVVADMIDRATKMYRLASESEYYEPYLDGYGFYTVAKARFEASEAAIEAGNADAAAAIRGALSLLEGAYPSAKRPETLDADISALTVAASEVFLTTGN